MAPSKWVNIAYPKDNSITTLRRGDIDRVAVYDDDDGVLCVNFGGELWEGSIVAEPGKLFHIKYRYLLFGLSRRTRRQRERERERGHVRHLFVSSVNVLLTAVARHFSMTQQL
jgi:hypothetical protein